MCREVTRMDIENRVTTRIDRNLDIRNPLMNIPSSKEGIVKKFNCKLNEKID
jgi:hypothetical protein